MVFNSKKCKKMSIICDKTPNQSISTSLRGNQLESFDSYKCIGVELNNTFDWDQQWRRNQGKIKSIPFLLKKLKRIGFKPAILKRLCQPWSRSLCVQFAFSYIYKQIGYKRNDKFPL